MNEKIFVVIGSCGEYSDRYQWLVAAFVDEEKAKLRMLDASRRAAELKAQGIHYDDLKGKNEFDPGFSPSVFADYASYEYEETELIS